MNQTPIGDEEAKRLIEDLTQRIENFNFDYYQKGQSEIDDDQFDLLLEQLLELEKRFPEFKKEDSPTQKVGGEPTEGFVQVTHKHPMLSLDNLYRFEDLDEWYAGLAKQLEGEAFFLVCELKIDGLAISLSYEKGRLVQAVTRGDGQVGDDVTANAKTIFNLPLQLEEEESIEVRGEIFLSKRRFEKINQLRKKEELPLFKNPRNAAAGSIRMKNPKEVRKRGLEVFLYDLIEGHRQKSHLENIDWIEKLGLPATPHRKKVAELKEVKEFCSKWEAQKKELPFEIDGVVLKIDDLLQRERLGRTSKSPKWAIAWKFKSERATSRLLSVENSIGRTGILTPVANLEPVELLGTQVKRATLHNYEQIGRLGIHEKDALFVEKGGDIIPKIVGVDYTQRKAGAKPLEKPKDCPVCATPLNQVQDLVDLYCPNEKCPAVIQAQIEHFVSKKGMDIRTLGSALTAELIEEGLIEKLSDIYLLHEKKERLQELEGLGEKSLQNLFEAIEKSKRVSFNQFIYALGIRHIGEKAAKALAYKAGSIEGFMRLSSEKIANLGDFGDKMVQSVLEWLSVSANKETLTGLIDAGLNPTPLETPKNQPFLGRQVVITGSLSKPRRDWVLDLERVGFKVSSAISKKTSYLLVGENPGSKLTKAEKLGIEILTENQMEQLLEGGGE